MKEHIYFSGSQLNTGLGQNLATLVRYKIDRFYVTERAKL